MPKFITLAGRKQVGKDTSAFIIKELLEVQIAISTMRNMLRNELHGPTGLEPKVHVIHFADALKDACSIIFGINRQDMETEDGKKKLTDVRWPVFENNPGFPDTWRPDPNGCFMTVREVLQFVGTDLFRTQIDPDIWVKSVYRKDYSPDDVVIVADCRFPNEADFAKKHGLLVKIERTTNLGEDTHISEKALDNYANFDEIIDNNRDMGHLVDSWQSILKRHGFMS